MGPRMVERRQREFGGEWVCFHDVVVWSCVPVPVLCPAPSNNAGLQWAANASA